jgi:hypothetical protein
LKIIYNAGDLTEAHIVAGLLNANGIETHVGGYYLQGGIGELAAADFISIQVADDDVAVACAIIADYESSNEHINKHNNKSDNNNSNAITAKKRNAYIAPLLVIALSLLLILLLTFLFSDQQV